jgi:maltose alpha-D-glucosyltransferase/alpha-amylase
VVNHTSDQHPWFQRARRAAPGSPERDFYVWSATGQEFAEARIQFSDSETSNWAWDPVARACYWHRFFAHQPDLNFDNPQVLEEVKSVLRFQIGGRPPQFRGDVLGPGWRPEHGPCLAEGAAKCGRWPAAPPAPAG